MRFKSGADVHSSDGKKVGRLRGVVMTPGSDAITGIIVERGFLFTEDRMIPVDWIAQTSEEGNIRLSEEHQTFDDLERFDENVYIAGDMSNPADIGVLPTYYYYGAPAYIPNAANLGPALATDERMHEEAEMGLDEGDVTVRVGIDVISSDDHHVGRVDEIIASAPENRLSHFVVSKGNLFTTRKMIPMQWIGELGSDRVLLAVSRDFMERLPDFDEKRWNTQGDEYATNHDTDNMNDTDDVMLDDEHATTASSDDTRPRRPDHADKTGVETSRSRD